MKINYLSKYKRLYSALVDLWACVDASTFKIKFDVNMDKFHRKYEVVIHELIGMNSAYRDYGEKRQNVILITW